MLTVEQILKAMLEMQNVKSHKKMRCTKLMKNLEVRLHLLKKVSDEMHCWTTLEVIVMLSDMAAGIFKKHNRSKRCNRNMNVCFLNQCSHLLPTLADIQLNEPCQNPVLLLICFLRCTAACGRLCQQCAAQREYWHFTVACLQHWWQCFPTPGCSSSPTTSLETCWLHQPQLETREVRGNKTHHRAHFIYYTITHTHT